MAISITPSANQVLAPGDAISFDIDNTYTTLVIFVETATGTETAYNTALGGAQSGYTVVVEQVGGTDTFTVKRGAGWDKTPFKFSVQENESGSTVLTETSYQLTTTKSFPQEADPYFNTYEGGLVILKDNVVVAQGVGAINFEGPGVVVEDQGNGMVRVTIA